MRFGSDIDTFIGASPDLDPLFEISSEDDVVVWECARRLLTPTGFLEYDPEFGFDMLSVVGSKMGRQQRLAFDRRIVAECEKSERVRSAKVSSDGPSADGVLSARIGLETNSGSLQFVFRITNQSIEVIRS